MRIHRLDADHLATAAAAEVARRLRAAHSARGRAAVAFSGGSTPAALFDALVHEDVPWPEVHVLQTDERMAPAGSPDRNLRLITQHLTARVALPATNLHPIPVEDGPAEAVADRYAEVLAAVCGGLLDLVHLGLGADGHTASVLPGDPAAVVDDRDVVATTPDRGRQRVSLSRAAIDRARHRLWYATGAGKRAALESLLAGGADTPAARVRRDATDLFTDIETTSAADQLVLDTR